VLSGMSSMQQVVENLESAERSGVGSLTEHEIETVDLVRNAYKGLQPVGCTECSYCMPCPQGVDIPQTFHMYNQGTVYNQMPRYRRNYANLAEDKRAGACIDCGVCEEKCPQRIEIRRHLKDAHASLAQ